MLIYSLFQVGQFEFSDRPQARICAGMCMACQPVIIDSSQAQRQGHRSQTSPQATYAESATTVSKRGQKKTDPVHGPVPTLYKTSENIPLAFPALGSKNENRSRGRSDLTPVGVLTFASHFGRCSSALDVREIDL